MKKMLPFSRHGKSEMPLDKAPPFDLNTYNTDFTANFTKKENRPQGTPSTCRSPRKTGGRIGKHRAMGKDNIGIVEILSQQHRLIESVVKEINELLESRQISGPQLSNRMELLRDQLDAHVEQEDALILTWLKNNGGADQQLTGQWFERTALDVTRACGIFFERWLNREMLAGNREAFTIAFQEFTAKLHARIEAEEVSLFPSFRDGGFTSPEFLAARERVFAQRKESNKQEPPDHDASRNYQEIIGGLMVEPGFEDAMALWTGQPEEQEILDLKTEDGHSWTDLLDD